MPKMMVKMVSAIRLDICIAYNNDFNVEIDQNRINNGEIFKLVYK